ASQPSEERALRSRVLGRNQQTAEQESRRNHGPSKLCETENVCCPPQAPNPLRGQDRLYQLECVVYLGLSGSRHGPGSGFRPAFWPTIFRPRSGGGLEAGTWVAACGGLF